MSPENSWLDLCEKVINKIDKIDDETPWQETEPEWWIHMQDVRRALVKKRHVRKILHKDGRP